MLVATVAVAVCGAEARLVYYSFQYRDVDRSAQGLLMAERGLVSSARVFRNEWTNADAFVLRAIVGGSREVASGVEDFLIKSQPGDFLVAAPGLEHPGLVHVRSLGVHALYGRTAHEVSGSAIRRTPAELTVPAMPAQERAARGS
jgi:hypothetical protein